MINVPNLPPFKRMCVSIGNLPTAFMESMTYYEALEWLYKYLADTIIPTVNTTGEAVTELQNAFTTLENYVNNYFENLDVQEEINNKLDAMAESGELTDIIAQYLQLAGMLVYNTLSDLQNAENLVNGSVAKTLGKTTYNDGYGKTYKVREIINTDIIDNINIVQLNNYPSLIAELVPTYNEDKNIYVDSIPFIVKYDTKAEALQNLEDSRNAEILNNLIENNTTLIFGNGYYPMESPISMKLGIQICSLGNDSNLLFPNGDGLVFDSTGYFHNILVHDIKIESKSYCINFKNDNVTYPNNVYKSKFYNLYLTSEENDCIYAGNNIGIGNDTLCFNLEFNRINVNAPSGSGFYGLGNLITTFNEISDFGSIKYVFHNCSGTFTNCNTSFAQAEWFIYDDSMANKYNYIFHVENCNFENVTRGCIYFNNSTSGIQNITIKNCTSFINYDGDTLLTNHPFTFKTGLINSLTIDNLGIEFPSGVTWSDVYNLTESTIHTNALTQSQLVNCYGKFSILSNTNLLNINQDNYIFTVSSIAGNSNLAVKHYKELNCDAFVGGRVNTFYTLNLSTSQAANLRLNSTIYDGIVLTGATGNTTLNYIYPNKVLPNNQNGKLFTIINNSGYNVTLNATTGYQQNYIFLDSAASKVLADGDVMCCIIIMIGSVAYFKEVFTQTA